MCSCMLNFSSCAFFLNSEIWQLNIAISGETGFLFFLISGSEYLTRYEFWHITISNRIGIKEILFTMT